MYVIRYRTLGPWQSEPVHPESGETDDDYRVRALRFAAEYAGYGEVVLDLHVEVARWKNGSKV